MLNKPVSIQVDLLQTPADKAAQKKTAFVAVFFACLVGLLATIGAYASYRASSHGTSILHEMGNLPVISEFKRFATGQDGGLGGAASPKTPDDRINILFLGVGGEGHDGPELTDTIILTSYDTKNKKLAMLSIPRDLAFPLGNSQFTKINSLNAIHEKNEPGQGSLRTAQDISALLNIRIDHVVRVDFKGFEDFIDALGGVDINVEKTFTDSSYPVDGTIEYRTISFTKGQTHMDGKTALEFVRSRHGNNGEGSDFARSHRQQLVIHAVRDKLLSLGTLTNPKKLSNLFNVVSGHIQTDLSAWDMVSLTPYATQLYANSITMRVLTDARDGELVPANVNGAYMLFPKKPDWSEIRAIAANPFVSKEDEIKQLQPQTAVNIEIKNGTNYEGYAFQVSQKLKSLNYTVPNISNAAHRGYERTIIYDLTYGKKAEELVRLKKILDADISTITPQTTPGSGDRIIYTEDLAKETVKSTSTDFLIILGESSLGLIQPYQ